MTKDSTEIQFFDWLKQNAASTCSGQGWIRTVRLQKNMLGKELAAKMHVSPARISVLEKEEPRGAVTLNMMQKAADALDCTFVYALIPNSGSQQAKPRIRLDSSHMKRDKGRQLEELQQQYQRSTLQTGDD